jgi:hypothetical protein
MDGLTEFERQLKAANLTTSESQVSAPKAVSASYDPRTQRIVIELSSCVEISFSPKDAEKLENASPAELDPIRITASGFGIYFPRLDAGLRVPALLAGRLGSDEWIARRRAAARREQPTLRPVLKHRAVQWEVRTGKKEAWRGLRPILGGSVPACPPERAESQVEKDRNDDRSDDEDPVIGTVRPTRTHAPKVWGKSDYRQKEEGPGDFKPHDAADAAKRAKEASYPPGNTGACLAADPPCRLRGRADTNWRIYNGLRGRRGALAGRQPLRHDAARDAYADAQSASNRLWSHPIYDGSSDSA